MFALFIGEVGAGTTAVAVAAAQAAIATLPMQPGRRGSGTLKAPYAVALGEDNIRSCLLLKLCA